MKSSPILQSYNAGELSTFVRGRTDLEKYFTGCEVVENCLIVPEGPLTNRPGAYFVAEIANSNVSGRLKEFLFSTIQGYILEFGHLRLRFYMNNGQIFLGTTPYEITTPYREAELHQLQFCQSADVMWIFHPSHPMWRLTRTGHTAWTLTAENIFEAAATAITAATQANPCRITSNAHGLFTGDIVWIEAVGGMTQLNNRYFRVTRIDVNNVTLDNIDSTGFTAYTTGGTIRRMLAPSCGTFFEQRLAVAGMNTSPQTIRLSRTNAFNDFAVGTTADAPLAFTLASERVDRALWLVSDEFLIIGTVGGIWRIGGATKSEPITPTSINARRQNTLGCLDLNAILAAGFILCVRRGGKVVNEIGFRLERDKWEGTNLNLLSRHITEGGIRSIALQQEPFNILWCIRGDGQLLGMTYERDQNVLGWVRILTDGVIESVAVLPQNDAEDQIWLLVRRTIGGITRRYVEYFAKIDFEKDIRDSFFVDSGLSWDGGAARANITNITNANPAVVTHASPHGFSAGWRVQITGVSGMTEVNCSPIVAYTVAAVTATTYALEGINSTSWKVYTGGGTAQRVANSFSGIGHLEGKAIAIVADGANYAPQKVSHGGFNLKYFANRIHAGLPYQSTLKTMDIESGGADGTAQGKIRKISQLVVRFHRTVGATVGYDEKKMDVVGQTATIPFGAGGQPQLFTGDKTVQFPKGFDREAKIVVQQRLPLPFTVVAIMPKMTTQG